MGELAESGDHIALSYYRSCAPQPLPSLPSLLKDVYLLHHGVGSSMPSSLRIRRWRITEHQLLLRAFASATTPHAQTPVFLLICLHCSWVPTATNSIV